LAFWRPYGGIPKVFGGGPIGALRREEGVRGGKGGWERVDGLI